MVDTGVEVGLDDFMNALCNHSGPQLIVVL